MEILSIRELEFPPFSTEVEYSRDLLLLTLYITSYSNAFEAGYFLNHGDGPLSPGGAVRNKFPLTPEGYADACNYVSDLRMEIIKKML